MWFDKRAHNYSWESWPCTRGVNGGKRNWNWSDYNRHYDYKNRCGTWADFVMTPMTHQS